jgi:hypothetical protein
VPIDLRKAGPGHYVSTGANLPITSQWELLITARVSAFNEYTARIDVPIR